MSYLMYFLLLCKHVLTRLTYKNARQRTIEHMTYEAMRISCSMVMRDASSRLHVSLCHVSRCKSLQQHTRTSALASRCNKAVRCLRIARRVITGSFVLGLQHSSVSSSNERMRRRRETSSKSRSSGGIVLLIMRSTSHYMHF